MRILVIEPGDEARSQMKLFFEKRGAIVHSVGRLEKIKTVVEGAIQSNELFDLILIEVRLPDCWEFYPLKKLNECLMGRRVPIFVMSSGFGRLALKQMSRYWVMGYIRKPFLLEGLEKYLLERLNFFSDLLAEKKETNKKLSQVTQINRRAVP